MLTYSAHFQSELEKLIQAEIDRMRDIVVRGHASLDHAGYKHNVGIIFGLERALELVQETESILRGAERRG
jgi:hypothetical protein